MEAIERLYEALHLATEHYLIYHSLKGKTEDVNIIETDSKQFWVLTQNAHVQMYIEIWCKVFGTERNNDIYWNRFISEESFLLELQKFGIDKEGLESKSWEMKKFRDKYISHSDSDCPAVPVLDKSISILCAFDKAIGKQSFTYAEAFGTLEGYVDARQGAYEDIVDEMIASSL